MQSITKHSMVALGLTLLLMRPAAARDRASEASEISVQASIEVPVAMLEGLAAGGTFSVTALRPLGESVELVLASAVEGSTFVLLLSAHSIVMAGLSVGSVVIVTATAAGCILSVGSEVIAFVPSAASAALTHQQALLP
ncbi:MAG: hypothetical protein ACT4NL_13675 [Pseudomarimonas sp.]